MSPVNELQCLFFFTGAGCTLFGWYAGRAALRRQWKAYGEKVEKSLDEIRKIINKPFEITSVNGKPLKP